jgi:hypothetical protein
VALQWERSGSDREQGGARREAASVARAVGGDEDAVGETKRDGDTDLAGLVAMRVRCVR